MSKSVSVGVCDSSNDGSATMSSLLDGTAQESKGEDRKTVPFSWNMWSAYARLGHARRSTVHPKFLAGQIVKGD